MKAKILTLILAAAVLCGRATTVDNTPAEPPYNVLEAVGNLEDQYGDKSKKTIVTNRNGATGQLESSLTIIPFECPNGMGIITAVKEAFEKDKDLATRWGLYEPGNGLLQAAYTGNTPDQNIKTRDNIYQGLYFINTTNPDNPTLRDQVAVQWQVKDKVTGKIFRITSLKPELVEANAAQDTDDFDWSQFGIDMEKYKQGMEKYKQGMKNYEQSMEKFRNKMKNFDSIVVPSDPDILQQFHTGIHYSSEERQLKAYKQLLEIQNKEIYTLEQRYKDNGSNPSERRNINKRLRKLHKQAQKTTDKMEKLIKELR